MPELIGINVNTNRLSIFLHYSVPLTPFNAKDVLILRVFCIEMSYRNLLYSYFTCCNRMN